MSACMYVEHVYVCMYLRACTRVSYSDGARNEHLSVLSQ